MNPLTCEVVFLILCFVIPITLALQTRRKLLGLIGGDDANALSVLGANFGAGFVAGTLAAGATCPLDVAKTRRQIEVYLTVYLSSPKNLSFWDCPFMIFSQSFYDQVVYSLIFVAPIIVIKS